MHVGERQVDLSQPYDSGLHPVCHFLGNDLDQVSVNGCDGHRDLFFLSRCLLPED
jgi:hypothetical protein